MVQGFIWGWMGGGGLFSVGCVYSEFRLRFLGKIMERRSIAQVTQVSAMEMYISEFLASG